MQKDRVFFRVYHFLCVPKSQMEQQVLYLKHITEESHTLTLLQEDNSAHCTQ